MDDVRKWLGENKLRSIGGGFPLCSGFSNALASELFQASLIVIRICVRTLLSGLASLRAGLFWLGSCGGILSYQLTKPITTSAAIMHTRVYAQV